MKTLKQLLFAAAIVIGISMTASAQDGNGKKTPPKEGKPPVINVPPKNPNDKPKDDKPKNDDKRRRPDAFMFGFKEE